MNSKQRRKYVRKFAPLVEAELCAERLLGRKHFYAKTFGVIRDYMYQGEVCIAQRDKHSFFRKLGRPQLWGNKAHTVVFNEYQKIHDHMTDTFRYTPFDSND